MEAKNYHPVNKHSFFFKKLINGKLRTFKGLVFSLISRIFFAISGPTDNLFRVVVDNIGWVFNVSSATRAIVLDTSAEAYLEPC